jgi:two-component system, chemotaxis family, sensor kinase CheA
MSQSSPHLSQEAIREFLIEAQEGLERVETDLVELERDPHAPDAASAVGRMFRTLHSIKGTCAFLGYPKLEEIAHVGENLLGRIREGVLQIDASVIAALLSVVDAVREVLNHIASENDEGNQDYSNLTDHLSQILHDSASARLAEARAVVEASESRSDNVLGPPAPRGSSAVPVHEQPSFDVEDGHDSTRVGPPSTRGGDRGGVGERILSQSDSIAGSLSGGSSPGRSSSDLPSSQAGRSKSDRPVRHGVKTGQTAGGIADSTLRVDVALCDKMMMLAGELVLTRNQILQEKSLVNLGRLQGVFRQLNSITSELQSCIMKSRMQPISTIWKKMPRTVRDVALAAFKQVRLVMEGADTELDKTIIEAIRDPLTHLLRNAVDHGIELPELRVALGKPAEGRIWMRAYHAGGQINIEIGDDGAGIDPHAIRRTALERNLVAPAQLGEMNDLALLNLIFQPGFSTTKNVTKLSGRGVGLDVVKSNIEKLGGAIHVQSALGEGTTFTLRIPLTLAIVQALIVTTAGDSYALPQARIVELVRLRGVEAKAVLDAAGGVPNYRFRGRLLPIVSLRDLLELEAEERPTPPPVVNLVVLNVYDRHFGLVVDRFVDNQEIVIKPLWQPLRTITAYAGATQLADGTVALILDPVGLARRAGLVPERYEEEPRRIDAEPETDDRRRVLLARLDDGGGIALSADRLSRIEEVPRSRIETLRGQDMLPYDGSIIRVVNVAALVGGGLVPKLQLGNEGTADSIGDDSETIHIALYAGNRETVGLIVGAVVDVFRHPLDVRGVAVRPFVEFTAMVDGHLVEFLDVDEIIESVESCPMVEVAVASTGDE